MTDVEARQMMDKCFARGKRRQRIVLGVLQTAADSYEKFLDPLEYVSACQSKDAGDARYDSRGLPKQQSTRFGSL